MKLPGVFIVHVPSPHRSTSRGPSPFASLSSTPISDHRRRRSRSGASPPDTPSSAASSGLSHVSRPDTARAQQECICHEILRSCLCREPTQTKDGVCDMCLYGIHVEEQGELFGDGYRAGLPLLSKSRRRWTPPAGVHKKTKSSDRQGLSTVMENNDGSVRGFATCGGKRLSRHREASFFPIGIVLEKVAPGQFDEHNMF